MGGHSSLATRAQPCSPPTWQAGPSTPPPHPLHQCPRSSSNTPRAQPPFTFVGLPSVSGAGQQPQPLDPPLSETPPPSPSSPWKARQAGEVWEAVPARECMRGVPRPHLAGSRPSRQVSCVAQAHPAAQGPTSVLKWETEREEPPPLGRARPEPRCPSLPRGALSCSDHRLQTGPPEAPLSQGNPSRPRSVPAPGVSLSASFQTFSRPGSGVSLVP